MLKKILNSAVQGLFWIFPITVIVLVIRWSFKQIDSITDWGFNIVGFDPEKYQIIWMVLAIIIVIILLAIIGFIATTRLANIVENIIKKIPFYSSIKDIVGIFNSSKKDKNKVLVVAIKGFTDSGYNIGLMYSTKESIIKDHYTVTLSMSPIPNGGFMFEIHKDNILIIDEATFNDNLQYLLSMGVKSMTEILNTSPKEELIKLEEWLNKRNE